MHPLRQQDEVWESKYVYLLKEVDTGDGTEVENSMPEAQL